LKISTRTCLLSNGTLLNQRRRSKENASVNSSKLRESVELKNAESGCRRNVNKERLRGHSSKSRGRRIRLREQRSLRSKSNTDSSRRSRETCKVKMCTRSSMGKRL
jgi:hypothetical protein